MTPDALRQGLEGRRKRTTGVVTSWSRRADHLIVVRREGEKFGSSYHESFWEREEAQNDLSSATGADGAPIGGKP